VTRPYAAPGADRQGDQRLEFCKNWSRPRRFPPPWAVEELDACFVVRDANGETLAYVYCEEAAAKLLKGRRIAANIAELPELLPQHNS